MPFSAFGLNATLISNIRDLNYTKPTPVQEAAINPAIEGRDLLVSAATGSGKTAAFLLPTIHRLMQNMKRPPKGVLAGPRVLVVSPTRELAAQIHDNLLELAKNTGVRGAPVYGGVSMRPQEWAFRTNVEIIVATPGRLLDHAQHPYVKLSNIEILILDEADRMLDMGFLPDIKRILQMLPAKRQTLFFSATMPPEIRELTKQMLVNPQNIAIEKTAGPAVSITQSVFPVPTHLKSALLLHMLNDQTNTAMSSVICFTRTKHRANRVTAFLERHEISCAAIHGNRSQAQRTAALEGFRTRRYRVLVATDIAARGIDISGVSHVINFDCPHLPEDYIHRVGRTGRADATGDAFTFVSPDEDFDLRRIEKVIKKQLPRIMLPDFDYKQIMQEKLEIPLAERIAKIRAEKAAARERRDAKLLRQQEHTGSQRESKPRKDFRPQQPNRQQESGFSQHPRHQKRAMVPPRQRPHFGEHFGDRNEPRGEMSSRSNFQGKPSAGDLHRQASNNPGRRKPHLPGHGGPRNQNRQQGNHPHGGKPGGGRNAQHKR